MSVYDKSGLEELARYLLELGAELISTGGTEDFLRGAGLAVRPVQDLTGFPEMLGGRVKTLHPAIHAGLLARPDQPQDVDELERHGFAPIDLVVCNLYPFVEGVRDPATTMEQAVELIDIGGVTLLRAAAKNFKHVLAVCDPADYPEVMDGLRRPGGVREDTRQRLAAKAFQHCAVYDACIANYLASGDELFPQTFTVALEKVQGFRYGENPHQLAALYRDLSTRRLTDGPSEAMQLHGIPMAYNNTYDLDVAWRAVNDFNAPTAVVVNHANPCGLACDVNLVDAFRRAVDGDSHAAVGGAVAFNRPVDQATAEEIAPVFFEDIIAPGYAPEALEMLRRKADLRVFQAHRPQGERPASGQLIDLDYRRISGGFLVQTRDTVPEGALVRDVVTTRHPTLEEVTSLLFAWRAVKHVRSHGTVLARKLALVGVGAGQMSRQDSVNLACLKAGERAAGSVMACDAYLPFPDAVERAADAGVTAIIQPGGSSRDEHVIEVANRSQVAMIFTHQRHYRHG
jgi:phosphoribosylaminoimidazolecarboxamide formyltransferase/IMP cyclohydrolase